MIEQTRFLSTVFLCSEFKLADIYSGVNFLGKNACANFFFWRETKFLRIVEKIAKSQKLEPVKISCHTVNHGTTVGLGLHIANCHYQTGYKVKKKILWLIYFVVTSLMTSRS